MGRFCFSAIVLNNINNFEVTELRQVVFQGSLNNFMANETTVKSIFGAQRGA